MSRSAPGSRCPPSGSGSTRSPRAPRPSGPSPGRSRRAIGTSTPLRVTATRPASDAGSGPAGSRVSRSSSRRSSPRRRSDPEAELERSLERLAVEQVDLYLVHSPRGGPKWAWPGMERALERGLTKSIGVSNFGVSQLGKLVGSCTVPPGRQPGPVQPLPVPPPPGGGLPKPWDRARGLQPADARRAALDDPSRHRVAGRSAGPPPRCCCDGRCNARRS